MSGIGDVPSGANRQIYLSKDQTSTVAEGTVAIVGGGTRYKQVVPQSAQFNSTVEADIRGTWPKAATITRIITKGMVDAGNTAVMSLMQNGSAVAGTDLSYPETTAAIVDSGPLAIAVAAGDTLSLRLVASGVAGCYPWSTLIEFIAS